MKYLTFLFIVITISITSCTARENIDTDKVSSFSINEEFINTGILQIYLPKERPKKLAVQTPNAEWFTLHDPEEGIEIMPQTRFNSISVIELQLENIIGDVWRNGEKSREKVFNSPGSYLIYFADNLETERDNTFSFQYSIIYP